MSLLSQFFDYAEALRYKEANLSYYAVKVLSEAQEGQFAVSKDSTSGSRAKEDQDIGQIQICPAEEMVVLIDRFKSNRRTFSSFWF